MQAIFWGSLQLACEEPCPRNTHARDEEPAQPPALLSWGAAALGGTPYKGSHPQPWQLKSASYMWQYPLLHLTQPLQHTLKTSQKSKGNTFWSTGNTGGPHHHPCESRFGAQRVQITIASYEHFYTGSILCLKDQQNPSNCKNRIRCNNIILHKLWLIINSTLLKS